ncbi:MAG: EAL domain-containing protein, partial [Halioglobus sp.]|nr:EAL domain-containing protein [Halioglobus sp.]
TDAELGNWLDSALADHPEAAARLCIEVPETAAFRHIDAFKVLCKRLQARGCRVGIEHMGHQLANLGTLHDVGLDYLKVDAGFVHHIDANPGNQALLRALCTLGHTLGVSMIAEGVNNESEWQTLQALGMDGATGPGIVVRR